MNGVPQTAEIPGMAESFMLKAKAPSNVNIKAGFRVYAVTGFFSTEKSALTLRFSQSL